MGLDMYLSRKSYVKNWNYQKPEDRHEITVNLGGKPRSDIKPERISYIVEQVAYWRKANHIHKWFVDNCQDGVDDCRNAEVTTEQLQTLLDLCKQVMTSIETVEGEVKTGTTYHPDGRVEHHTKPGPVVAQQQLAEKLLPTKEGFFFGGTEYDEYYLEDIKLTIEQLEPILAITDDEASYEYHSSW